MKCLLLLIILSLARTERTSQQFEVYRSYDGNSKPYRVATLTLFVDAQYSEAHAQIQLQAENVVEPRENRDMVSIMYVSTANNQTFQQTLKGNMLLPGDYKEIVGVILNNNYEVLAINYFQEKLKKKEISSIEAKVFQNQLGKQYILTYSQVKKPGEEQEETFFSKYKWYIIGFVALVFMMSKADPEAMQQQMQQR